LAANCSHLQGATMLKTCKACNTGGKILYTCKNNTCQDMCVRYCEWFKWERREKRNKAI